MCGNISGSIILSTQSPSSIDIFLAAAPLLLAGILLVGLLWPATKAMPFAWISTIFVGYFVWDNTPRWLVAASITGVITALTILWIVFGALVLLYTLKQAGALNRINQGFVAVSDDRRVQIILLGFFLATFIEGAAGFGTPAAVVAPLLLALGFPALAAVIAALIGHIIAVTYGAVGTPIIIGIRDPLDSPAYVAQLTSPSSPYADVSGPVALTQFSNDVAAWAATFHALVGFVMPLFAVAMVVYFFGDSSSRSLQPVINVIPLCLVAGFLFVIPYWAAAWFLTAEFPSIIGAMVGGAILVWLLRAGYFVPQDDWEFPPREEWPSHWVGTIEPGTESGFHSTDPSMSLLKAWSPYGILVLLLVVTRTVDPIRDWISDPEVGIQIGNISLGVVLRWNDILGTGMADSIAWIDVPGFWLILSSVLAIPLFKLTMSQITAAWIEAAQKIVSPFVALVFVIAMVEVMLSSGLPAAAPAEYVGTAAYDVSMIESLAITTAGIFGGSYPFIAALIGALGAAIAGSNTVSNVTFSSFQFTAATELSLPRTIIVGSQAVGGAVGNLVAIHNVVAALATVGLVGEEGRVMRLNFLPLIYYTVIVGFLTLLFSYVLFPNVF